MGFNPVVDIVERWAADAPEDLAVLSLDDRGDVAATQTAADLADAALRFGRVLMDLGVTKGDRVFIMLPRIPEFYVAMLGAIRIGAVPAPGTNQLTSRDIAYRLERSAAAVAVVDPTAAAKVDAIPSLPGTLRHRIVCGRVPGWSSLAELIAAAEPAAPSDPTTADDPMLLFFTSGTTRAPKLVEHTMSYALAHVSTARLWHGLHAGDRHWTVTDTGWAKAAWGGLFGQWHERATVVQAALARPDAASVLGALSGHRITSFCAPPTLYRTLVQADLGAFDFDALEQCTSAGEPLNPEVIRAWKAGTGLTIRDGYGQTETTCIVANLADARVRPGSMGRPMPGYDVDVVDGDGERAADDEIGSIAVRCGETHPVGLFHGYAGDPEATAESFRDGWYHTGDSGWRDPDGYLWFHGRDDDVITSSAYRIGPFEVESALIEHPAVVEAAVVGKDDPERTQIVTAFCVLAAGAEGDAALAEELQRHVKTLTAPYKYPREIHFVESLPKTVSGKIRRAELRDGLRAGIR